MKVRQTVVPEKISAIGKPLPLRENLPVLAGDALYTSDLDLPGTRFVGIYRSPYAHAKIVKVDYSRALELRGVSMALCGADLLKLGFVKPMSEEPPKDHGLPKGSRIRFFPHYCLAVEKVRFVGEPVVAVVATDRYTAEDALELVDVEFEPLEPVSNPEKALHRDSPLLYEEWGDNVVATFRVSGGKVEEAFEGADFVVRERIEIGRTSGAPIEPRAVVADYSQSRGLLTLWTSCQSPHLLASLLQRVVAVPSIRARVVVPRVGGSFGLKNTAYPEDVLVAILSVLGGTPMKWVETRSESLVATRHARDQVHVVEAAVRNDGKILGLRDSITADVGAAYNPTLDYYAVMNSTHYVCGAYDIQNYEGEAKAVVTNKTPTGPFRGFGKAEPSFVIERLIDIISRRIAEDPTQVRMKNFIGPEAFPYVTVTGSRYDSGDYPRALKMAMERLDYPGWREKQRKSRATGRYLGIGCAVVVEPTSTSRGEGQLGYYGVRIRMNPDGKVDVYLSGADAGQGHETSVSQIISEELQIPVSDVRVVEGDTQTCPLGFGSHSSRFSVVGSAAVMTGARKLREKVLAVAAEILSVPTGQLDLARGLVYDRTDPGHRIGVQEVAHVAYHDIYRLSDDLEPGLEVIHQQRNPNVMPILDENGRAGMFGSFPYDSSIAVVEVDVDTGETKVLKYVSVHDCGNIINSLVVSRQHLGALVHGIGEALHEEVVYDAEAQPLTTTFQDYLVPTALEVPEMVLDHLVTPDPFTPGGFKGAGETGTISAPAAIANAIEDALKPLNVKIRRIPLGRTYLKSLIREAVGARSQEVADLRCSPEGSR